MKPYVLNAIVMLLVGALSCGNAYAREPALTDAEIDAMMNAPMPPVPKASPRVAIAPSPEEPKIQAGMHNLKVATSSQPATVEMPAVSDAPAPILAPTASKKEPAVSEKTYMALAPKDALLPPDKLTEWPNLGLIVGVKNQDDAVNLVKAIEADRGAVPPQALFLTARILAQYQMMEQAALYYFVGQLRLTFDVTRWPPQVSAEDLARIQAEKSKTPDQRQNSNAIPKFENPHNGIALMAGAISKPILRWAMDDPARMTAVLNAAKEWDASATYAYLPGYDVGKPAAFQDWERALGGVRVAYFASMDNVVKGLKKNSAPVDVVSDEYDDSAITKAPEAE